MMYIVCAFSYFSLSVSEATPFFSEKARALPQLNI